jgi:hypothetical protein
VPQPTRGPVIGLDADPSSTVRHAE